MSDNNFKNYSFYYDLLYQDKDYQAESTYISELLRGINSDTHEILEFGSGTGRHGRILGDQGFQVTGIELSAEMVAEAEITANFKLIQGDVRTVNLDKKYDAVVSLFHVMSYQISNESVELVFKNASTHLNIDGVFMFDFWYTPAVYSQTPEVRLKTVRHKHLEVHRIAEPVVNYYNNTVDVNYTIFGRNLETNEIDMIEESHKMRHFSLMELDLVAKYAGFKRVIFEEYLTSNTPSSKTWGVCLAYQKVNNNYE
jgi:hypothetical protein